MLKPNNGPHPEIPGKTRQLYPTSDISDLEVVEEIDCLPEDYQPVAPETAHPDNQRTGFALKLVSQGPSRINPTTKMERVYMSLPGAWVSDTRIDPDGAVVTIKTRKQLSSAITSGETFASGVWTKTTNGQGGDAVLGDEVVETRAVPGNWITRTRIDADGAVVTIKTRKQAAASIASGETLVSGVWTRKTNGAAADALIGDEIVETRAIPGNDIPTQSIATDGDISTETRTLFSAAGFVASSVIASGTWTRTFDERVDGTDLVVWKVVQVRTTQASLAHYVIEIPERSIPPKLRSALPTTTTETTIRGTASLPSFTTGDFYRSEQQLDQYSYRRKVVNLALTSLPISVTDKGVTERYGGGPTTLTYTLSSTLGSVDEGLLVLSSKVDILGNGLYLKTTEARDGSAWPTLPGGEFDDTLQAVVPFTTQVVASGSSGSVAGDVVTEVKPIDYQRSQQIIRSLPTATIDAYSRILHNTCNVDLPSQLISVAGYWNKNAGTGSYSELGTYDLGGHGAGGIDMHGSAQGSAAIVPETGFVIKTFYGVGKPCLHILFFVAVGTSRAAILSRLTTLAGASVSEWPVFAPKPISILCKGGHVSAKILASAKAHSNTRLNYKGEIQDTGEARSGGSGVSFELGVNNKLIHIPPTIHAALTLTGDTDSQGYSSACSVNTGGGGFGSQSLSTSGSVSGSIINVESGSTSIAATPGQTTMPTSGLYLTPHGLISEPDRKYDRIRVLAEIVDFSNIR